MRILFIGDIYGRPGREAVKAALPTLRERHRPDFVIANSENAANGKGVTDRIVEELLALGIDVLTGGNHSLHQRGSDAIHDSESRLLRPANFPPGTPGRGLGIFHPKGFPPVAVINLCGRAFMQHFDDPYRAASALVAEASEKARIVVLDFHAEATSEKVGMGWYLDGQVTAVLGTHTHIPTADETVLPGGTAYITDAGMSGPYRSIIGADIDAVLTTMVTLRSRRFDVAEARDVRVCGVLIDVDEETGRARAIERIRENLGTL